MKSAFFAAMLAAVALLAFMAVGIRYGQTAVSQRGSDQEEGQPEVDCSPTGIVTAEAELHMRVETALAGDLQADPSAALEALYTVGADYQQLALDCGFIPPDIGERFVGSSIATIMAALEELPGDPINGQLLYNGETPAADGSPLTCAGCHSDETIAPLTEGTWTRWDEIRSLDPALEGYTFAQYMVESIVLPGQYPVPDYSPLVMPSNFGERLSYQDLADLIAYLESQDQLLDD